MSEVAFLTNNGVHQASPWSRQKWREITANSLCGVTVERILGCGRGLQKEEAYLRDEVAREGPTKVATMKKPLKDGQEILRRLES